MTMAENLVNDESLNKLLETIPRRDHDKIKHLCDGLSITEVLVQGVDPHLNQSYLNSP